MSALIKRAETPQPRIVFESEGYKHGEGILVTELETPIGFMVDVRVRSYGGGDDGRYRIGNVKQFDELLSALTELRKTFA